MMKYEEEKQRFQQKGRLVILLGKQAWSKDQWPVGSGVYLIWRRLHANERQLLYIGKAGKYCRKGAETAKLNGGTLAMRLVRWTPYCFQCEGPYAGHFEYGPLSGVNTLLKMPHSERYQHHVSAEEIEVECFCLAGMEVSLSPALLEANLLQEYLVARGDLPVANNEL
jgi:hypothetical protein